MLRIMTSIRVEVVRLIKVRAYRRIRSSCAKKDRCGGQACQSKGVQTHPLWQG